MNLEPLKSLIPHINRDVWTKFVLVLEYFALQRPQSPTHRQFWCVCVETTKPRSPQAFVIVDRHGHVLRFYWVRPNNTDHQHTYWDQWLEKATEINAAFAGQKAQEAQSQREAERLARDVANRELEAGWGYDVAVTVTVTVQKLPRKNVALPKEVRWNWVVVAERFKKEPKAHRLEQLLADQLSHFQLEVDGERHYRDLLHSFSNFITKAVSEGRLQWDITVENAVVLAKKGNK
jgi:hypothetical protein